jgi:hypothetical protein
MTEKGIYRCVRSSRKSAYFWVDSPDTKAFLSTRGAGWWGYLEGASYGQHDLREEYNADI